MAIISKLIEGLTNDVEYFVRVYPINHKGFAQSELDGQVASVIPKASRLPDGYTELAYIQSSGTQYIDTGFKPNQDTRVVASAGHTDSLSGNTALFGARTSTTVDTFTLWWYVTAGTSRFDYNTAYLALDYTPVDGVQVTVDANKNICSMEGHPVNLTYADFQCDYNLFLFATNTAGTAKSYFTGKIYSCQIYDNDVLVRDFVPCVSDADGVGLYDLVNSKFYTNAGTGTFTAGSEVA